MDQSEHARLCERYGGRVPRYTSYPTAPYFLPVAGDADYQAWLAGLGGGRAVSLYVHVPFCAAMCWYCGCNTRVAKSYEPIALYARMLAREIGMLAPYLSERLAVQHLHWGGGTPTMMA